MSSRLVVSKSLGLKFLFFSGFSQTRLLYEVLLYLQCLLTHLNQLLPQGRGYLLLSRNLVLRCQGICESHSAKFAVGFPRVVPQG